MKRYIFDNWTDRDKEDLEIQGEDYRALIDICCDHSDTVAFQIARYTDKKYCKFLNRFAVEKNDKIKFDFGQMSVIDLKEGKEYQSGWIFCKITPELRDFMKESVNSIFDWCYGGLPDDLTFFRSDGREFFSSVIHEGDLYMYLDGTENLEEYLLEKGWIYYPEETRY